MEKGAGVVSVPPECRVELLPAAFALFGKMKVDQTNVWIKGLLQVDVLIRLLDLPKFGSFWDIDRVCSGCWAYLKLLWSELDLSESSGSPSAGMQRKLLLLVTCRFTNLRFFYK